MQQPTTAGAAGSYNTRSFVIAAGASAFVDTNAQLVAVLDLSGADDFSIRLNDGQVGRAFEGWQFRAPTADGVRAVELINPAATSITVELAFAVGEVIDGRFALPGALAVDVASSVTVASRPTYDVGPSWHTEVAELAGTWELVAPAANTAGLLIRHANLSPNTAGRAFLCGATVLPNDGQLEEDAVVLLRAVLADVCEHLPYPIQLVSGYGLYAISQVAFDYSISWTLW